MITTIPRERWAARLDRFTERNAGRRAVLEVDGEDIGAQRVIDSPLWGVTYDAPSGHVEMLFGDFGEGRSHLTHAIAGVSDIEILTGPDDRDTVLRIGHEGGQTLLHLPR